MSKQFLWRVRVRRVVEDWVEVPAVSAREAELAAARMPRVIDVLAKQTVRADFEVGEKRVGVQED